MKKVAGGEALKCLSLLYPVVGLVNPAASTESGQILFNFL